jgi:hypothetical protein
MVFTMRVAAVLLSGFWAVALSAGAQVSAVRSVYLLPMSGHLDQYLANRITSSGLFQVVTDPNRADAVFSDHLGPAFEDRLAELFPEPKPEAAKPEDAQPKAEGDAAAKEPDVEKSLVAAKPKEEAMRVSSFGRGKGTIFLVDGRNRAVLWSFYEMARDTSPRELDRVAGRIADRLKRDFKKK